MTALYLPLLLHSFVYKILVLFKVLNLIWLFCDFRAIHVSIQSLFYRMYISQSLNLSSVLCIKEKSTLNKIIYQLYCEQLKHYRFEDFLELQSRLRRRYSLFLFSIPPTSEVVLGTLPTAGAHCFLSTWPIRSSLHWALDCI